MEHRHPTSHPAHRDSPPAARGPLHDPWVLAALLATPLFFSTNLIVGRAVVDIVPPWSLAFWRWAIAVAMLLPFTALPLLRHRRLLRREWRRILLLGFLGMVLCGGNVYIALAHTSATNATLIYTTSTLMIVVLDALLKRRRLPAIQFGGSLAGFAGIALITVHGEPGRLLGLEFNVGDLGILVAAIGWAAYSLMLRQGPLTQLGGQTAFAANAIAGTVLLAPMALWEAAGGATTPATLEAWGAIAFLAIFPSVLAFGLFQFAIKAAGAPVTANFLYLMPVYGVLLAVLLLGEELHFYHGVGFVLILGGVILATRHREPFARPAD
ncbi:drug/metabolite transporter (DMT)-like permease [Ancylobacter aquaticus]|uniref:Drug/metabolite transporter (DMT)-like permease n=1 Tax=Ancylobacter aquaticus TaxID=100 RepID=A0A4R1I452_ANCAQ|nr:DMT family transporter [Ancylobacter aquaticus]TCK28445.1 drug/metabolite transporter (DMT)-like permease [Ancylobacter aquaticus]